MKCTLKAYNVEFEKILEFENIKFAEQNESLLLSMYYEFEIIILRLKSILIFAPDTISLYQKNGRIYISLMCEIFRSLRSKLFFSLRFLFKIYNVFFLDFEEAKSRVILFSIVYMVYDI